jgi:phosphoglycolate phosphatase-like HAD superfamily hydrolase
MPAILFDIDGTLVDSEPDLRAAGTREMFDGPADLLAHLDRSPLDDRC